MFRYEFKNILDLMMIDDHDFISIFGIARMGAIRANGGSIINSDDYVWVVGRNVHAKLISNSIDLKYRKWLRSSAPQNMIMNIQVVPSAESCLENVIILTSRKDEKERLNSLYGRECFNTSGFTYTDTDAAALRGRISHTASLLGVIKENKSTDKNEATMRIMDVIFNDPATIVIWSDGSKTVVKNNGDQLFDAEKGLAMAIAKHFLGTNDSKSDYYDIFKRWLPSESIEDRTISTVGFRSRYINEEKQPIDNTLLSASQVSEQTGLSRSTINKNCLYGKYPNAKKVNGKWRIPYGDIRKEIKDGD